MNALKTTYLFYLLFRYEYKALQILSRRDRPARLFSRTTSPIHSCSTTCHFQCKRKLDLEPANHQVPIPVKRYTVSIAAIWCFSGTTYVVLANQFTRNWKGQLTLQYGKKVKWITDRSSLGRWKSMSSLKENGVCKFKASPVQHAQKS